ncbi:MAG: hypothetical protein F4Y31_11490 [Gammaproteobacteria bacterium]|nr:hypothetical protein [Gammaproteobacteria bacterium]MYF66518.1 hypothetical protein [Gammaproteobacteria bacterium]MYK37169.1 hypothetical protein [Gammaproteobacteria bacterium]
MNRPARNRQHDRFVFSAAFNALDDLQMTAVGECSGSTRTTDHFQHGVIATRVKAYGKFVSNGKGLNYVRPRAIERGLLNDVAWVALLTPWAIRTTLGLVARLPFGSPCGVAVATIASVS